LLFKNKFNIDREAGFKSFIRLNKSEISKALVIGSLPGNQG